MAAVDEEFDLNQLDTGLPHNFDGVITGSEFVHDPEYQNGEPLLLRFTIEAADSDVGSQLMKISTGKAWEAVDSGRGAQREDGKRANFHESSGIGLMMKAMIDGGSNLNEIAKAKGAMPWQVEFWDGIVAHWDRVDHDYGGEIGVKARLLPTKLLDLGGKGGKASGSKASTATSSTSSTPAKGATKKAAPKAESASSGGNVVSGVTLDDTIYKGLFELAYNAASYEAFQTEAYENEDYASNDDAITAIEDQSDDSLWGRAVVKYNEDHP